MFTNVRSFLKNTFDPFLFGVKAPKQLGLTRLVLCSTILYLAVFRQLNMDQYGLESLIPRDSALAIYPSFYRPLFEYFFWPDSMAPTVGFVFIGLMILNAIGLTHRILLFASWVILQGFINRNYSMLFGADLIGALFLFYLSFTNCTEAYSIKSLIFKKKRHKARIDNLQSLKTVTTASDMVSSTFFRIMQVQLAVIYAYTGFEKLKGATWWDGTALWTVIANSQFTNFDLIFMRNFPILIAMGTFISLIFEIYFPVMVAFKKTRYWWLGLGALFHLMIGILLSLMPFSLIMISIYFLFFDEEHLKKLRL